MNMELLSSYTDVLISTLLSQPKDVPFSLGVVIDQRRKQ